jgi:hypothetical protein
MPDVPKKVLRELRKMARKQDEENGIVHSKPRLSDEVKLRKPFDPKQWWKKR